MQEEIKVDKNILKNRIVSLMEQVKESELYCEEQNGMSECKNCGMEFTKIKGVLEFVYNVIDKA